MLHTHTHTVVVAKRHGWCTTTKKKERKINKKQRRRRSVEEWKEYCRGQRRKARRKNQFGGRRRRSAMLPLSCKADCTLSKWVWQCVRVWVSLAVCWLVRSLPACLATRSARKCWAKFDDKEYACINTYAMRCDGIWSKRWKGETGGNG